MRYFKYLYQAIRHGWDINSSAAAEMGDRLATINMDLKERELLWEAGPN